MLTVEECIERNMSKMDVIEEVVGELQGNVDTTLPQPWLNYWTETEYCTVRFGTVWSYIENSCMGAPLALTVEAHNLIEARMASEE